MHAVACPNCGAEVVFRSPALPVRVCDYCRSMVVRASGGTEAVGKVAVLPYDISPVQIGMSGTWDEQPFEIIGRVRWGWSDGAWNEWLMLMADGGHAWLGEAMGQFMALRERSLKGITTRVVRRLLDGRKVAVGETGRIGGVDYQVADVREVRCIGCEGELPFTLPNGWQALSVDFRSPSGACASFQKDSREALFYVGRYVDLAALKPANLRAVPGWSLPAYAG